MICPTAEPASRLHLQAWCSPLAFEREHPALISVAAEEWTRSTSNGISRPSVDCSLSTCPRPAAAAQLRSGIQSPQQCNPLWLQEDPIATELQDLELDNGELFAASGRLVDSTTGNRDERSEESLAEDAALEIGDASSIADMNKEPNAQYTTYEELTLDAVILDAQCKEDINESNSVKTTLTLSKVRVSQLVNGMKECAKQQDLLKGHELHADLLEKGLLYGNVVLGNALIDMYAQCHVLDEAENVFHSLHARSVASWNTLVSRYVQSGHNEKAVDFFESMQLEGFSPNAITFSSILKAFGSLSNVERGREIHEQLKQSGLLETNVHVGTALVDMYAKCGWLSQAQELFDKLPNRNVVSWTALIIGYTNHDLGGEALRCFEQMLLEGFSPDQYTLACAIKACCSSGNVKKGRELHAWAARECYLEKNPVITGALVDMYAKCGELELAQGVFNSVPYRDKVSWTALINGYAQHGYGEEALVKYEQMLLDGFIPNEVTFSGLLKACSSLGAIDKGQAIHAQIIRTGLLNKDVHVGTALVDMYGKCGLTSVAEEVFENLAAHSLETWTAIISAFVQFEEVDEAFHFFKRMQAEHVYPDAVTFSCLLIACGSVAALEEGRKLHLQIVKLGLIEEDSVVGTSLVDMYVNCGVLVEAQDVFDELDVRDLVTWGVLIGGYAQFGKVEAVLELLDDMIFDGKEPNEAIFTLVLNACSHGGLMDKAHNIFMILSDSHGLIPSTEQYACMIDLFGRAGLVEMAGMMILEIPSRPNLTLWTTLLSACRKYGPVGLGRWSFDQAILQDEKDSSAYICMHIIYAAAGKQEDAAKIEEMQIAKQAWPLNEEEMTFFID